MSFGRAKVERFNEVKSCAPPMGSYDPKFPSMADSGSHTLYKVPRFSKENVNHVPLTPTPDSRKVLGAFSSSRGGPSFSTGPRRPPGSHLMSHGRSASTVSLPLRMAEAFGERETEPEFEIRSFRNMGDELIQQHESELDDLKDKLNKANAEQAKLLKQIEVLSRNLADAENRIVELVPLAEKFQEYELQLRQQKEELAAIHASQEAWMHQANHAIQKNGELESKIASISVAVEKEHLEIVELRGKSEEQQRSQTQLQELQVQFNIQLTVNKQLETQLQQTSAKYGELSVSVQAWKAEAEDAKKENGELKASLNVNSARCAALESSLKESQEKFANLSSTESELKIYEVALKESQSSVNVLTQNLSQKDIALQESLTAFKGYKAQSEVQRSQVDDDVNQLHLQIKILDEINNQKNQELSEAQQGLDIERSQTVFLRNDLEMRKAELVQSETSLRSCSDALKEERRLNEETAMALKEAQARILSLNSDYTTRLEIMESLIASQNTELEQNMKELAEQSASFLQLNLQLYEKCKQLEECQNDLNVSSCNVQQLELNFANQKVELEEVQATANEYKLECEKTQNVVQELEQALANQRGCVANLEELIKQKDEQLKETLQTLLAEQEELLATKTSLDATEAELADTALALQSTVENLNQETILKDELVRELKDTTDKLQHQFSEQEESSKLIYSLQLQISAKDLQLQSQLEEITSELTKSQQLSSQLDEKCGELQMCQNKLNGVTDQIDELKIELATKDLEINDARDSADTWKMYAETDRKKNQELQQTVADQELSITSLGKSVAEKDKELSTALKALEEERGQCEILTVKVEIAEAEVLELEKSLEQSNDSLRTEILLRENQIKEFESKEARLKATITDAKAELTEYFKRTADFELKMTTQSIKIATLKNELDEVHCTANQLKSHLNERTDQLEKTRKELEKTLVDLEEERVRFTATEGQLRNEAEARNHELKRTSENARLWQSRFEEGAEEREKSIQRLKFSEIRLAEGLEIQLKDANKTAELKKSETEIRVLNNFLTMAEQKINSGKQKLVSVEAESRAANDTLKAQCDATSHNLNEHLKACTLERQQSREKLEKYEAEMGELKADNSNLKSLIGPFEEQLNLYKANLDAEKGAAAVYKEKASLLLDEQARIMGHQNSRQKIHHLQKLKEENQDLVSKNVALEKDLKVKNKLISDLQTKMGKQHRRIDPSQAFQHRTKNNMDPENLENLPA